jgi:hypothetical protein
MPLLGLAKALAKPMPSRMLPIIFFGRRPAAQGISGYLLQLTEVKTFAWLRCEMWM